VESTLKSLPPSPRLGQIGVKVESLNCSEGEVTIVKDRPFLLAVAFSVVALMPLAPTSQAAGRPECLVSNERTGQESKSLQDGIDAASSGDTLVVKGTCVGNSTITKNLRIKGVSNPAFGRATLDGDGLGTVVTIADVITVAINDLTIGNGSANEGGGIFNWYGSVTLTDSVVSGNRAPTGGGISNRYGAVAVTNTTLIGNTGISGGGIFSGGGTFALTDSIVTGNAAAAGEGGGIFNGSDNTLTLTNSTVAGNNATYDGGGIANTGAFTLNDSTLTGNTSFWGGGIANWYGTFTLNDSTVRGNTARFGGGVYIFGGGPFTLTGTSAITNNDPDNCYPPGSITGCTN
jgi:hypothetical protein